MNLSGGKRRSLENRMSCLWHARNKMSGSFQALFGFDVLPSAKQWLRSLSVFFFFVASQLLCRQDFHFTKSQINKTAVVVREKPHTMHTERQNSPNLCISTEQNDCRPVLTLYLVLGETSQCKRTHRLAVGVWRHYATNTEQTHPTIIRKTNTEPHKARN